MEIKDLNKRQGVEHENKASVKFIQFEKLIEELKKREIPPDVANSINLDIEVVNSFSGADKDFMMLLAKTQSKILVLIEKRLKLVTKNYYRNTWLALGMAVFGLPLGTVLGASLGNMAYMSLGLPFGLVIGMAVGAGMDKKAIAEGRQLDLEII
jgi:hypothetical protein